MILSFHFLLPVSSFNFLFIYLSSGCFSAEIFRFSLNWYSLSGGCISAKLGVTEGHVCFLNLFIPPYDCSLLAYIEQYHQDGHSPLESDVCFLLFVSKVYKHAMVKVPEVALIETDDDSPPKKKKKHTVRWIFVTHFYFVTFRIFNRRWINPILHKLLSSIPSDPFCCWKIIYHCWLAQVPSSNFFRLKN